MPTALQEEQGELPKASHNVHGYLELSPLQTSRMNKSAAVKPGQSCKELGKPDHVQKQRQTCLNWRFRRKGLKDGQWEF